MPFQTAPATLDDIKRPVRDELDRAFEELRRIVASDFSLVSEVNSHLLRLKGKMLRPTLLLLSAKATGGTSRKEEILAAVVELIHVATLVHDDSVDHSVLRRGQPTINSEFSHQVAVIMGDYLYSKAILELVELDYPDALKVMARVTNEMTIGEMRQLEAYDYAEFREDDYDLLIRSKTASLMSGACEVGALVGDRTFREPLQRYGGKLGMAFQIADDVLDYTGSENVTGKPAGLDLKEHKTTLPLICALPHMSPSERATVDRLMADPEPDEELIAEVVGAVEARGGLDSAMQRAQRLAAEAEMELDLLPASDAREALAACVTYAVERRK